MLSTDKDLGVQVSVLGTKLEMLVWRVEADVEENRTIKNVITKVFSYVLLICQTNTY